MPTNKNTSTIVLATVYIIIVGAIAVEIYAAMEKYMVEEKEEPKLFGLKEYSKPKSVPPRETTCGAVCGGKCGANLHENVEDKET